MILGYGSIDASGALHIVQYRSRRIGRFSATKIRSDFRRITRERGSSKDLLALTPGGVL